MLPRLLIRATSVYYWCSALVLIWHNLLPPMHRVIVRPGSFTADRLFFDILPHLMFILLLIGMGRILWGFFVGGYELVVLFQTVLVLCTVVPFVLSWQVGMRSSQGIVNVVVQSCLFVLLLFPAVPRTYTRLSEDPAKARRSVGGFTRASSIGVMAYVIAFLAWWGVSGYTLQTQSASLILTRLTGSSDMQDIPVLLLEQLPVGTEEHVIRAWLETHAVPRDRFVGGQFIRYQVHSSSILALFSTPPWVMQLFCSQEHYGLRFVLDAENRLESIVMENYTRCL